MSEYGSESIGKADNPLPSFPVEDLLELLNDAIPVFQKLPNVLRLEGDFYIVGDLHGNIRDLVRILAAGGSPSQTRYLFLGDYVDRGDYSVEVITFLISMAMLFPQNVFLLRGNHEYEDVNSTYGFKDQVLCIFGSSRLFSSFQQFFAELPIAAIVNGQHFCVHGGLSPLLQNVSELDELDRRMTPPPRIITDIMWSDPVTPKTVVYIDSERGKGCKFGHLAVKEFLKRNGLQKVIRAHQFAQNGVFMHFDSLLYSIFSTCNYKGEGSNTACILRVTKGSTEVEIFRLPLIKVLRREDASFIRRFHHERSCLSILKLSRETSFTKPIMQGANKFCKPVKQPIVRCTSATQHIVAPKRLTKTNKAMSMSNLAALDQSGSGSRLPLNRHVSYAGLPVLPAIEE